VPGEGEQEAKAIRTPSSGASRHLLPAGEKAVGDQPESKQRREDIHPTKLEVNRLSSIFSQQKIVLEAPLARFSMASKGLYGK
jgi:hypothetical protein